MAPWPWDVRLLNEVWLRIGWDWLRRLCVWRMRRVAVAKSRFGPQQEETNG